MNDVTYDTKKHWNLENCGLRGSIQAAIAVILKLLRMMNCEVDEPCRLLPVMRDRLLFMYK